MKKHSLLKGTFILGFASIFAKFLGMFFRIPLTILIGDEGIGYYQMAYPLYMLFIAIASGVPLAMSKIIAERKVENDDLGAVQVLKEALLFMIILGLGTSVIMISFSHVFIRIFKWNDKAYPSLIALSSAPIFIAVVCVFRGFFQGLQNMTPTAVSQIIEQIGRLIVGLGLAVLFYKKGIEYSAGGATLGAAAGGIAAGVYLISRYIKVRKEFKVKKVKFNTSIMSRLLRVAIPISLGAGVGSVMNVIDSIIVPQKLIQAGYSMENAAVLYGQLTGKAAVLVNIPFTLSMALCASLTPIISEAYKLKNIKELNRNISSAIKISFVIALPSLLGIYFLAYPILNLVFRGQVGGYQILKYFALAIPFVMFAQVTTIILQATNKEISPIIHLAVGCVLKVFLTSKLVAIPNINIYGAIVGTIGAYALAGMLNIITLKKNFRIKIDKIENIAKPALGALVMIFPVIYIYSNTYKHTLNYNISCLLAIFTGIIIYGIMVLLLKIFSYEELKGRALKKLRR